MAKEVADIAIPDASLDGAVSAMQVDQDLTIEAVQLKVNIDHERVRDIAIELTSPSGTRSVVLSPRTGFLRGNEGGFTDALMLTHHFYGENSKGNWTIKVLDTDKGNSYTLIYNQSAGLIGYNNKNNELAGVLKDWSLKIYGH
ncbi:proprotein convertase P-domain-containing protein [Pseudoalteromonas xiamenensis]